MDAPSIPDDPRPTVLALHVAAEPGRPVGPGGTRRNVTLSHGEVPTEPGDRVRIGEVELEVVRLAAPCRMVEDSLGPGGRAALRRRGGSVLRVLHGGTVRVGDHVDLPVMLAR